MIGLGAREGPAPKPVQGGLQHGDELKDALLALPEIRALVRSGLPPAAIHKKRLRSERERPQVTAPPAPTQPARVDEAASAIRSI